MQLSNEDIKTLVNGIFQSSIEMPQTMHGQQCKNSLHPIELFLNDLIAINFSVKNEPIDKLPNMEDNNTYSPFKTGIELTKNKYVDYLPEYLHLCRSYQMHLHPVVAFYHFIQSNKAHNKAVILDHSNRLTTNKIAKKGLLNPQIIENDNDVQLSNQELLFQMFLKFRNEEYRKKIYSKLGQLSDLINKRAFIENLTAKQKSILPPAEENTIHSASKKWNTQWLKLQLSIKNSPASLQASEQIFSWFNLPDSVKTLTAWSLEGIEACGIDTNEEWLFFLISNTPLKDLQKTMKREGMKNIPEYLIPALLQNALYFRDIKLFNIVSGMLNYDDFISMLEKVSSQIEGVELDWEFIKKSMDSLTLSSETKKWKIYALLLKHYQTFLPDSFTLELIPVIKDNESRVYMTEEGIKMVSFLTEKLSLHANPIHLPKLENHLQQLIYHPLEKQIEKLIGSWRFRLEMRKKFEREKKVKSTNEKK